MAASLSAGVNSLILKLDTPYDSVRTYDIRDDLVKVKVWCSATQGFTPTDTGTGANLVFNASGLSITITALADNTALVADTPYYVRYAFISAIEETEYTLSAELTATPVKPAAGSSVSIVFKRSATVPQTPDPSASTPGGWYPNTGSVPAGTDPIWASIGSKASGAANFTWQLPIRVEGYGVKGDSFRIAYKTQLQQTSAPVINPSTTTGNTSFPTGWEGTITTPTAGQSLWAADGIYNTPADTTTWGTPYLTQGFPTTIQSDNYNAIDTGWQIQRDTGNAFFNNVTARGSLVTGDVGAQRIEINKKPTGGVASNRLEAFTSDNIRFLTLGGSGGTTADTAVIGISANSNVINPVWIESSANTGSNILSNTLAGANAYSAISTGNGRLFYGSVTNGSNPDAAFRIDINSAGHNKPGFQMNMNASTGAAFSASGTGDGYVFDGVTGTSGAAGSKSGIAYLRGIDFPTTSSVITSSGTSAKLQVNFTNLTTAGDLLYTFVIEGTTYSFLLGYDAETFNTLQSFVIAIAASINNTWQVSSTGTLASGSFILTRPTVGAISGTNTATIGSFTGTFTNGTNTTYSSTPTVVRLTPFPNDTNKVLRGDGSWGTVSQSGGASVDRRYNVRDYGALGNGANDDTSAIQAAINAAAVTGGTVYLPRGIYYISSSLTYTSNANDPGARVHFAGDGVGASLIKQTSTGDGLTISGYTGSTPNPNLYTHITDLSFVGNGGSTSQGLKIVSGAYAYVEACHFTNWGYGFYGANFLSSTFTACEFRFNQRGFMVERIAGGNYASSPNAITLLNCEIGANSLYGGWILGAGVFTMQGGAVEANGTTTGSTSNWGLRISEPSGSTATESAVGVSLDGVYFEVNKGIADLWISSSFAKPGVTNNINGCSFLRVGSTYVTNNILLDSDTAASSFNNFISGCGFKGLGGYTPSASRMTIVNGNNKVNLVGCSFDSSVDAYASSDSNVFENPIRVAAITDLNGTSFAYIGATKASGTASAGTSLLFAKGDHVHPFSVTTATASATSSLTYDSTTGALTYTPPTVGNVSGSQYQIGYYATAGTALSGTTLLTYEDNSLYVNKAGVTDLRVTHNLPTVNAPGISSKGSAVAIASGFNNSTGSYTAGILVTSLQDSAPSFSGNASNGTKMNLGTSTAQWDKFYWGTATTGILAPSGDTTKFLRNDGTWATVSSGAGTVTSVAGTGSGLGFSLTGTVTTSGSITLATPTVAALQSTLGLGGLAYVSSLTSFTELNSTALAANTSATGSRILATSAGARTWATMSETRAALGENGGTASATTFLRGDGTWSGTGTVTSITAGTGLSGSTITTSGTIALANTAVTAGSYTNASLTVDAQGRLTAASSGTAPVTSVGAISPVSSTGGTTPTISMAAATASVNGYMTSTYASKLDGIAAGATNVTNNNQLINGSGFITSTGINSGNANQLAYYASGSTVSSSTYLTYEDNSLYSNKSGVTDVRVTHNLPGVTAPGLSSTGVTIAIASGFNNSTGSYTAGVAVTNVVDSAPSFSGKASNGTAMNLGTSVATWNKFYWGTVTSGITAPAGGTTTFLRNDGSWATPTFTETDTLATVTARGASTSSSLSTGSLSVTGSITATGDITAYSDKRLKTNIKTIPNPFKGMEDIYGVTYDRTDTGEQGMGFIAQAFEKHYPNIVSKNENGLLSLKYLNIIAILWEQNRELYARVQSLEAKYDSTNK